MKDTKKDAKVKLHLVPKKELTMQEKIEVASHWNLRDDLRCRCSVFRLAKFTQEAMEQFVSYPRSALQEELQSAWSYMYIDDEAYSIVWQNEARAAFHMPETFDTTPGYILSIRKIDYLAIVLVQRDRRLDMESH